MPGFQGFCFLIMKVTENITRYECDFCKKRLYVRHAMEKHEKICDSNPENSKACFNCKFLERTVIDVYFETHYHPDYGSASAEKKVDGFKCSLYNKLMFPWKIERKELHIKYPGTYDEQEPMPKECDGRQEQNYF